MFYKRFPSPDRLVITNIADVMSFAGKGIGRPTLYISAVHPESSEDKNNMIGRVMHYSELRRNSLLDEIQSNPKRFYPRLSEDALSAGHLKGYRGLAKQFLSIVFDGWALVIGDTRDEVKSWAIDFYDMQYYFFFNVLAIDEDGRKIAEVRGGDLLELHEDETTSHLAPNQDLD
ncbi:MAG: hypothetical protein NTV11_15955 [Rhodocyclales bacterium]|nr:hypothetical protein [Rhodocyclales bacterium]